MGHNESNTRRLNQIEPSEECTIIHRVLHRIHQATGRPPSGWLSSGLQETWHTLEHLIDAGSKYVADWVNDDQPYVMHVGDKQIISLNYSMEINDKPVFEQRNRTSEEFENMIRRQVDVLYREGAVSGRVMAIALHSYIIEVPL
jgi:allantoinase